MSRTLQNTFALAVTNLALAAWVRALTPAQHGVAALTPACAPQVRGKDVKRAVHLLVAATAVLRCDLVLLLAPVRALAGAGHVVQ
jgi:hypothetical protein